jgi:hypothetical protein
VNKYAACKAWKTARRELKTLHKRQIAKQLVDLIGGRNDEETITDG